MENQEKKIFSAINGVMKDIGAISKNKKNTQQGFMYRGIDQIYNALQPAMIKNGVFVVPEVVKEEREERTNSKGTVIFSSRITIKFRFYATDGSFVEATTLGEAIDTGDKATNKAMSVAYKYACFQVFCIPTEEMKDPDAECHNVAPEIIYVDETKIKVLKERMAQKGVIDKQIFERYEINSFEELTVVDFMKACSGLEKMPDVGKQVDLGL